MFIISWIADRVEGGKIWKGGRREGWKNGGLEGWKAWPERS
jgi:hypothetical protein